MKQAVTKSMLLVTVILMDILSGMEFDLFVPSFPELQKQFGLTPFWVEALLSVNFIGYCLSLFFVGGLADRYGRKPIILLGLMIFIIGSILLAIFIVTERLGLDQSYLQWLFVANGTAMLIGGGLSMVFSNRIQPLMLAMMSMGMIAVGIFVVGASTMLWLTLVGECIIGLALPGLHIGISTIILKNSKENFVGRVNGILTPLFMGAMIITMALSGVLKEQFSLFGIYQISAAFYIIGVLVMLPMFRVQSLDSRV